MLNRTILILLTAALVSTGCGWHLRGKLPLSDTIKVIAVKGQDPSLQDAMAQALRGSGATVVSDEATARAVLDLYEVRYDRKVRTIDTRGKVTGYTLEYYVRYKVIASDGKELRDPGPMVVRRDFNFDPNAVLQAEDEERILREDMQSELSQRILRQLTTIALREPPRDFADRNARIA